MDTLKHLRFSEINLDDPFFGSLKADYQEFPVWFEKKAKTGDMAYILTSEDGQTIEGFMYLKMEKDVTDISPPLYGNVLKIGTFKFDSKGQLRGRRFLKKALDVAIHNSAEYIYLTVFSKHQHLIDLFETYGFIRNGEKTTDNGTEYVYMRDLNQHPRDPLLDYPFVHVAGCRKYLLAIQPQYHSYLFPESKLHNESPDIIQDVSHANSIQKIYLSAARNAQSLKKGDILIIYRTKDDQGPARYRAVATSVCTILEVKNFHISRI